MQPPRRRSLGTGACKRGGNRTQKKKYKRNFSRKSSGRREYLDILNSKAKEADNPDFKWAEFMLK